MLSAGIPRWFAALGLLLGLAYALFMGPLGVPDEAGHMYRSYLVSQGVCTGVPAIGAPVDYRRDLDRLVPWTQLPTTSTGSDLLKLVDAPHGRPLPVVSLFYAVNLYSCLPYLPAGAAFAAGRLFNATPLTLMYLGRFANLLAYLVLVLLALRFLPGFQLAIAALALMPMSLHQAGSLSADGVTMGVSFLLTAWLLRLATAGDQPLLRRDYLLLAAAMFVAGLCKSNAGLVFLLLLVPESRFRTRRSRWLAIAGFVLLAYGTAAVWQLVNRPNGEVYSTLKAAAGVYLDQNAAAILHRPFFFLAIVLKTLVWKTYDYLEQFVGVLGWLVIRLPAWIIPAYLALLAILSAATGPALPQLTRHRRLLLAGIFLLNVASLLVAFWTTETPHAIPYRYAIPIYGRYLIPFALLPMIAVSGLVPRLRLSRTVLAGAALGFIVLVNCVALRLAWNTYYGHNSTLPNQLRMALRLKFSSEPDTAPLRYEDLIVRRPGDAVEDGKIYLIRGGERHWIIRGEWLAGNGYTWPDDVNIIPPADLAAIPEGFPIR